MEHFGPLHVPMGTLADVYGHFWTAQQGFLTKFIEEEREGLEERKGGRQHLYGDKEALQLMATCLSRISGDVE